MHGFDVTKSGDFEMHAAVRVKRQKQDKSWIESAIGLNPIPRRRASEYDHGLGQGETFTETNRGAVAERQTNALFSLESRLPFAFRFELSRMRSVCGNWNIPITEDA